VKPELCVGAVVIDNERLLVVQRGTEPGRGLWSIPGGRVEAGETMAAAVVREVAEETSLQVITTSMVGWVERISPGFHFVIVDFAATLCGPNVPVAGDDADDVRWASLRELEGLSLVPGLLDFLREHNVFGSNEPARQGQASNRSVS
jgi:8-oxo-dGTP diphosphatase